MLFNPAQQFEDIARELIPSYFTEKHGKYEFSHKQIRLILDKEMSDLFSADIKDRIRDFEKSLF